LYEADNESFYSYNEKNISFIERWNVSNILTIALIKFIICIVLKWLLNSRPMVYSIYLVRGWGGSEGKDK